MEKNGVRKVYGTYEVNIWDKVLKNRPSKICGRQPLKHFTWSILEYSVSHIEFFWLFYKKHSQNSEKVLNINKCRSIWLIRNYYSIFGDLYPSFSNKLIWCLVHTNNFAKFTVYLCLVCTNTHLLVSTKLFFSAHYK